MLVRGPGELKVVNVHNEQKTTLWVPEDTRPFWDRLVTERTYAFATFIFPICSGIGMAVKGLLENPHWANVFASVPRRWPMGSRDLDLRNWAFEVGLNICLNTVSSGQLILVKRPVKIAHTPCFHGGRGTGQLDEDCSLSVLVTHLVAEENGSAFELSVRISWLQLRIFLDNFCG